MKVLNAMKYQNISEYMHDLAVFGLLFDLFPWFFHYSPYFRGKKGLFSYQPQVPEISEEKRSFFLPADNSRVAGNCATHFFYTTHLAFDQKMTHSAPCRVNRFLSGPTIRNKGKPGPLRPISTHLRYHSPLSSMRVCGQVCDPFL